MRLLSTESSEEASGFAMRLDDLNTERRAIEAEVLSQAMQDAEIKIAAPTCRHLIFWLHGGVASGVTGIAAQKDSLSATL